MIFYYFLTIQIELELEFKSYHIKKNTIFTEAKI